MQTSDLRVGHDVELEELGLSGRVGTYRVSQVSFQNGKLERAYFVAHDGRDGVVLVFADATTPGKRSCNSHRPKHPFRSAGKFDSRPTVIRYQGTALTDLA